MPRSTAKYLRRHLRNMETIEYVLAEEYTPDGVAHRPDGLTKIY